MQPSFIFSPTKYEPYTPADIGLAYEKVILKTSDGLLLSAWFVPANNAETTPKALKNSVLDSRLSEAGTMIYGTIDARLKNACGITILFCHGKGGSISYSLDTVNILNELGFNVFIFDYRGYGNSQGKPAEQGTYIDAQTAYDWLIEIKGFSPDDIIIFGRSLGGSIAAHLASNVGAKGLIVESGFTSFADIGCKFYPYMPVRLFARFKYNTQEYLKKVKYPVLIIHSRNDEIVPFEFGLRLYEEAASGPKDFLEIYGCHNDGFLHSGQIYRQGLLNWAKSLDKMQLQGNVNT
ncbi:MAG: alpha/beta fold hydrolase [Phycisphaerales bacterium]